MGPLGIRFNDCLFSEPAPLAETNLPRCAGLYVVLVPDPNWSPKAFQPVSFGEFGNNAPNSVISAHHYNDVVKNGKPLFVAVLPMPFSTSQERWVLRSELIWAYNPPSQTAVTPLPPQEPAAAPLPERRPIGFLPLSQPSPSPTLL
jgi:hypothetical protein